MAKINWGTEYGVPAAVGLGEMGLKAWDRSRLARNPSAMEYEPLLPYALVIGGTAARMSGFMSRREEQIKMAVAAALPRVVTGAYDWATTAVAKVSTRSITARRVRSVVPMAATPVSQAPAPLYGQGGYRSI